MFEQPFVGRQVRGKQAFGERRVVAAILQMLDDGGLSNDPGPLPTPNIIP